MDLSPVAFEFPVSAPSGSADAVAPESLLAALRESERHYRYMVECNPQIPWTADPLGRVDEISERWLHLTGLSREAACADGWEAAVHPDDLPAVREAVAASGGGARPYSARFRVRTEAGGWRWMWSRARPRFEGGELVRWYGVLEDIHDQVLVEEALRDGEERLRLAVRATGLGIWDHDVAADRSQWSDELKAILGLPADAPLDGPLYMSLVHPDDREAVTARYRAGVADPELRRFANRYRIRRADTGEERWVATDGVVHRGPDGRPARVLMTVRDVTEAMLAQERVLWAARHDPLTGLPNRALFNERLARLVEDRRGGAPFGLLLLDLDHLKQVNDTIGHDGGDAVLKSAAERLAAVAPSGDVARLGGDEFAVVVRDVPDASGLTEVAERLRTALAAPVLVHGRVLDGHASIGAALFPDHGRTPSALLKSADLALYTAKSEGRGRACLFERRMRAGMVRRAAQTARARAALAEDRIEPHYQPKVDLATGRVTGFEALLRWTDARGRPRRPADLQAAFDDYELAAELSERMLARVVADMGGWRAAGVPFGRVAVNVSNAEFARGDLTRRVLDRLAAAGLATDVIELELTETVLLGQRAAEVEETLTALSMAGVRLALDDFGTGFASLVHLKRFPIDVIKIDRSFTAGVGTDPGAAAIVRALIGLSRDLGMESVAEGVETSDQFRWLQHEGCTLGQGYLFGRAQPAALVPFILA